MKWNKMLQLTKNILNLGTFPKTAGDLKETFWAKSFWIDWIAINKITFQMETRVYLPGLRPYELLVQIFPMYGPLLFPVFS